jgi:cytochrome P450
MLTNHLSPGATLLPFRTMSSPACPRFGETTQPCSIRTAGSNRMAKGSRTVLSVGSRQFQRAVIQVPTDFSRSEYHSWNAGPRSCLGRALATYEGIAIVSAILQRFDIVLQDPVKEYEPLAALNMVSSLAHRSHDEALITT